MIFLKRSLIAAFAACALAGCGGAPHSLPPDVGREATSSQIVSTSLSALQQNASSQDGITQYPVPNGSEPSGIVTGPDGNLWFTEYDGEKIGKINPANP